MTTMNGPEKCPEHKRCWHVHSEMDADHVLRALNSHYELLKAAKESIELLRAAISKAEGR